MRERVSAKHLCSAINYLSKEKAYAPWQAANKILDDWHRNFQTSNKLKSFQSLVGKSVAPYYDHLTINEADDEPILNKLARKIAINLACEHGVPKCLQNTYSQFKEIINGRKVKPNSRLAAIFNGIRSASDDEISKLWSLFLNNEDKEERQEILSSLGNIARKATLNEYLRKSIAEFNGKTVDGAERAKIITTIAGRSQNGLTLAIQFLATELENVQKMTGLLANIIRTIAPNILTVETDTKVIDVTWSICDCLWDLTLCIFISFSSPNWRNWQNKKASSPRTTPTASEVLSTKNSNGKKKNWKKSKATSSRANVTVEPWNWLPSPSPSFPFCSRFCAGIWCEWTNAQCAKRAKCMQTPNDVGKFSSKCFVFIWNKLKQSIN